MTVRFTAYFLAEGKVHELQGTKEGLRDKSSIQKIKDFVFEEVPEVFHISHQILQEVSI